MKTTRVCIVSLIAIFLSSCGAGVGDTNVKLSSGYVYRTEGSLRYIASDNLFKDCFYPTVTDYAFNNDYILVEQEPSKKLYKDLLAENLAAKYISLSTVDSMDKELAPGQYVFYKSELQSNAKLYHSFFGRLSVNHTADDILNSELITDSLIKADKYYKNIFSRKVNYWIVDHKDIDQSYLRRSKIYGPLSEKEYLNQRAKLNVPETLKLRFEK